MRVLLLLICALAFTAGVAYSAGSGNVTTAYAQKMIHDTKGLIVLDVRTADEYKKGHLANAQLVDFYLPTFEQSLKMLPKSKPVLIYCKSGRRSANTLAIMQKLGFTMAYNMLGGFEAWSKEKRPSTTK